MKKNLQLLRWTREGTVSFPWSPFETVEKLVLSPTFRERLQRLTEGFREGKESYHAQRLTWRQGLFFFGPSGSGKSAAGRAIARALDWPHLTVPAHEILDSHLLERALADAIGGGNQVVVLEDVDLMIRRMEPEIFFKLVDNCFERADGMFWIATSRHPENAPKTQLVRPGRFDEAIRLELPSENLRKEVLTEILTLLPSGEGGVDESSLAELARQGEGLSYAHLEEMRQLAARLRLEKREGETLNALTGYLMDQIVAGDRWGGLSDLTHQLEERVKHVDPRVLMASLDMSDVFRRLMEKVIADAAEDAKLRAAEGEKPA